MLGIGMTMKENKSVLQFEGDLSQYHECREKNRYMESTYCHRIGLGRRVIRCRLL